MCFCHYYSELARKKCIRMCAVATCSHSHSYSWFGERVQVYIHVAVDEISNSRSIHKRYRSETTQKKTSPKTAMHKCGCDCAVRILKMSSRDHHHLSILAYPSIHPSIQCRSWFMYFCVFLLHFVWRSCLGGSKWILCSNFEVSYLHKWQTRNVLFYGTKCQSMA